MTTFSRVMRKTIFGVRVQRSFCIPISDLRRRNGCIGTMWAVQVSPIIVTSSYIHLSRTVKYIMTALETATLHTWSIKMTQMSLKYGTMFLSSSTAKMMGLSEHSLQSTLTQVWALSG